MKFNCDEGQQSLKLSVQLIFFGEIEEGDRPDSSQYRTIIIGLLHGAKESFESVRILFDCFDFEAFFFHF